MLVKRKLLQLALLVAVAASVVAGQTPASHSAPSVERLRAHVTYLASDETQGRRTGTTGANAAASYIAKEFSRYKLQAPRNSSPTAKIEGASSGGFLQQFPFVTGVTLGSNNSMLFTPQAATASTQGEAAATAAGTRAASLDLRLGEDWTPLGFSSNARNVNAAATFAGYGIKAAELNYDDYAGADVRGRIIIALAGTPDGDNPHGQFARYADARWKAIAAREKGAAALLIIAREENFRDERLARLSYDNSAGEVGLPVAVISRQAAARILTAGGLAPLAELEKALRAANTTATETTASGGNETSRRAALPLQNLTLSLTTDIVRRNTPGANVVGILEGSDAQLKNEAIIIGAHYDHLGRGGEGSLAPREGEIHHGADDNASGVAGLLELARIFSSTGMRPRRTLVFIAFGGEEDGLIGSNYYVNHPVVPLANTVAMINLDMIGRMRQNRLMIGGVGTAAEWRALIDAANLLKSMSATAQTSTSQPHSNASAATTKTQGLPRMVGANGQAAASPDPPTMFELRLNQDGYGPSDHSSFYAKQIPVLFFFTGTHEDYHKPSDTADKINYESEARILSLVTAIVGSMDASNQRPTYAVARSEGTRRSASFRVSLGVVPNYAESNDGMKIDGVRDDSPAAKAGIKAGDRITRMAGSEVRNVYDYTYALGEMKAGEEYEVEIVRGGETLKLKITPAARR